MTDAERDLGRLLPSGDPSTVADLLPPGRLVGPRQDREDAPPVLWLSDGPAPFGLWEELHRAHPRSGLWPLLLAPLREGDEEFRPWATGELSTESASEPDWYDPAALLRNGWEYSTTVDSDGEPLDPDEASELGRSVAPFLDGWPGTAPAADRTGDPDGAARALARELLAFNANLRIGLVAAAGGAEALTACGWSGPVNHEDDIAKVSAVLLDWERRYGTRVVQVGFAELELSVAAPPVDEPTALRIAAEHLAFCPDNIFQGAGTLTAYAPGLIGAPQWSFWWD
ncbi:MULTISPECIES: DUF4253 domain-containing protein [Kitasatospora]|uniref:DUF4253 domain-containing protein n=1 Tax=Kitasatospora setae (strain ATCC 33774 / DSM 43861 / JCM 3304 / KCC A-0304 / NBRC 14216 / KM-6054) TaxID=452652 RepID=E4NJA1_KITSK|nr:MULTISPECIES: DUF4253 domain-containing protein [Kitasatospora]BAJ33049.1 hypothetical protein KSE_72940 [Kitasatospora setae KM-6054]